MPRYRFDIEDLAPSDVTEETGWHKMDIRFLVTRETAGSAQCAWWRTIFPPGAQHQKHIHHHADEILYAIRGRGANGIGREEYEVHPGVALFVPKGAIHWMRNLSDTEPLEIVGVYAGVGSLKETGYEFLGEVEEADKTI